MKRKQSTSFFIRAKVDDSTIVESASGNTFEVVFATETPVFRRGWDENFNEILVVSTDSMRASRLDSGSVPLLNNHDQSEGIDGQMGRTIEWSIKNNEARAKILFSTRPEFAGVWSDIKAGVLRSISTGYNVYKYIRESVAEGEVPNYRAIDWEPLEISLSPVPADFMSGVRSDENSSHEIEIENFETRSNMTQGKTGAESEVIETRTAQPPAGAAPVNEAEIASKAVKAERQRSLDIQTAVRNASLAESVATDLIERGVTVDAARAEIIDKLAENTAANIRTASVAANVSVDESEKTVEAISVALLHRAIPGSVTLKDEAHDYKHMSMIEIARNRLESKGDKAGRYSPSEVVKRALSTTDFPNILTSVTDRSIRRTYDAIVPEWRQIARQVTAKDFRETNGLAVDQNFSFEEIAEGGEYKNQLIMVDDTAKIKLKTYGKKVTITRQAIINDDLSVFDRLPAAIAYGAADFQAAKVWALITGNAKTPDGKAIFHVDHTNLASGGGNVGAPTEALLSKARTSMYRLKTPAGKLMPIMPKFFIVPMELMTTAEKLMASVLSTATADVNTFAGKLQILSSPYLTNAVEWYLAGDVARAEGLVYAYLQGEEGLHIEKQIDFDNDCVVTKARIDFDCASWDYRNWYKNPGA